MAVKSVSAATVCLVLCLGFTAAPGEAQALYDEAGSFVDVNDLNMSQDDLETLFEVITAIPDSVLVQGDDAVQ